MGLIQMFQKEDKKKHSLGVCIPNMRKRNLETEDEKAAEELASKAGFRVSGIFQVQDTLMAKGTLFKGALKIKAKLKFNDVKMTVKEIQIDGKDCETITVGESGALFLKPEKGKSPIIKIDDILEF